MSSACNPFPQQSLQSTARRDLVMLPLTVQTVITCRLPLVCTFLTWFLNFSAKASVLMPFMHNYVLNHSFLFLAVSLLAFPFWDVTLDSHSLKEDRLNLAHGFRRFNVWSPGSKAEVSWWEGTAGERCSFHGGQETAEEQCQRRGDMESDIFPVVTPRITTQSHPEECFTNLLGIL